MEGIEARRARYTEAMGDGRGSVSADRLCRACVELLPVDGAAISIIYHGVSSGTFGSSSPACRELDEIQFTIGEGPCLDAVAQGVPVRAEDLADPEEQRWPAYAPAMLAAGVRAVHAFPITVNGLHLGALDLFQMVAGRLSMGEFTDAAIAAGLAELPLLDLLGMDLVEAASDPASEGWAELDAISRVEVNQAAGVLMAQLDISAVDALIRLRGHAYAHDVSTTQVAQAILDHRLHLDPDTK